MPVSGTVYVQGGALFMFEIYNNNKFRTLGVVAYVKLK